MESDIREIMNQVFTPGAPVKELDLFKGRQDKINSLRDAIPSPGRHPIIFGQRGVGKTSLANIIEKVLPGCATVRTTCEGSDSFKAIWARTFSKFPVSLTSPPVGFKGAPRQQQTNLASYLRPEGQAGAADVANVIGMLAGQAKQVVFVLDEFDRVRDETVRTATADLIKNVSDNHHGITLVLVGVGDSIHDLIGEHPSIGRNLVQIEMPTMNDREIKEIVSNGCHKVGLAVDAEVLDKVAFLASGFPHYAHLLGLNMVKACIEQETSTIDLELFDNLACDFAVKEAIETYRESFAKAKGSTAQELYENLLCACADATHDDKGFFRATDVVGPMRQLSSHTPRVQSLGPMLQALTEPQRGSVLIKTQANRRTYYRFRDPMMRPFLRIRGRNLRLQ